MSFSSPPLSARQTNLSPAKEGLHFVCFRGSPSISCFPNERGCCVPASPQRLEGARSPVPSPTWGSNYPSGGLLRGAPPTGQSNSHTVDFHLWAPGPAPIVREAPEAGCHMTRTGVMQRGRLSTPWPGKPALAKGPEDRCQTQQRRGENGEMEEEGL